MWCEDDRRISLLVYVRERERESVCFVVGRDIGLNANPKVEEGKRAF